MRSLHVAGNAEIHGEVTISGNKNAALPMIAALLLTDEEVVLRNVPDILDVRAMLEIAGELGAEYRFEHNTLVFRCADIATTTVDRELCSRNRTSILFGAPLLARCGRAELYPPGDAPKHLRTGMKVQVPVADLKQNIQMDSSGAFYLDIPMVDQGAKGYCVAATVARVLKYYGADVDQHLIAQLAKSDADRGTNINQTIESLEKTQSRLGIRVRSYYTYEINTWKDIMKMIKDYNRVAKRNDVEEVDEDDFILKINGRRYLNFRDLMNSFDFDTFCKFRSQDRRDKENFFEQVRESIDEGLPLCWATFILPGQDEANSEFGLHMRIINGYNPTTREIVYSDSWGAGHEKKTMSNDAAWGITINLFGLVPRNRRTVR